MRTRIRELTLAIKNSHAPFDENEIKRLYVVERWTLSRIAELYGCHHSAIGRRLEEMGVERRSGGRTKTPFCFCGKPTVEGAGAKCKFHRHLAQAAACRKYLRRKCRIPRERWRVTYDVQPRKTRSDKGSGMSAEQLRTYKTEKMRESRSATSQRQDHQSVERPVNGGAIAEVACRSLVASMRVRRKPVSV